MLTNTSLVSTKRKATEDLPKKSKKQIKEEEEESSQNEQSDEEVSDEESLESEELDDEYDLDDDDSDNNNDNNDDDDDDDDIPTESKQKKSINKKTDGSESFSSAITNILSSKIKAHSQKDPILVRTRKKLVKEKVEEKLELKAKKALSAERKQKMDKARVRNVFAQIQAEIENDENNNDIEQQQQSKLNEYLEYEKSLKKIGQRGVIKLFNAILAAQRSSSSITSNASSATKKPKSYVNVVEKEAATNVSKEKFLDLIRSGNSL